MRVSDLSREERKERSLLFHPPHLLNNKHNEPFKVSNSPAANLSAAICHGVLGTMSLSGFEMVRHYIHLPWRAEW